MNRWHPGRTVVLAAAVSLALAGCVSQTDSTSPATSSGTSAGTSSGPSAKVQQGKCAEAPGVSADTINLGVLTDLSGPVAAGGVPWSKGVQAYFDYANKELGGVGKRQVKLTVSDHAYNPQLGLQRYKDLEPSVLAMPLSFGSPVNNAISGQLVPDCMPLVANNGSVTDVKPNVFYNASTYEDMTLNGIDWYLKKNPNPKVALFYQGDAYGNGAKTALEFAAKERGFTVVAEQSYAVTDKSFSGQLAAITAAKPDVVLMASTVGATFTFFGAAQAAGAEWDWLGLQPTFAPAVLNLPIADAYVSKFRISTGQPLLDGSGPATQLAYDQLKAVSPDLANDPSALLGWQAAFLMREALVAADTATGGALTRGAVLDALSTLSVQDTGFGPGDFAYVKDSKTPGVPYDDSAIIQIDPATTGFLKVVQPYATADLVAGFKQTL